MACRSHPGISCLLAAFVFALLLLVTPPTSSYGQGDLAAVSHNPLREGELPWGGYPRVLAAPEYGPPMQMVELLPSIPAPRAYPKNPTKVEFRLPIGVTALQPARPAQIVAAEVSTSNQRVATDVPRPRLLGIASRPNPAAQPPRVAVSGTSDALVRVSAEMEQEPQRRLEPAPMPPPRGALESVPAEVPGITEEVPPTAPQPQMWLACASPCRNGVACPYGGCVKEPRWCATRPIPWQIFAQGEYVGPARLAHVPEYRIRVDDIIRVVYGLTGQPSKTPYELSVGDVIRVEAIGSPSIERQVTVQPDGMVTMQILGQVPAAGRSIEELRKDLDSRYARYIRQPTISVTPIKLNTRVEELRASVDQRYGTGGQGVFVRVTPAGFIQLPAIGSVPAQGLTLEEIKQEIEARYTRRFNGVEVTPVLDRRAPRYVFVIGEVKNPGRFELEGPTTAMQAIAMAGSWNVGAELRHIVVFRRDECWKLMATRLDLRAALGGRRPCPTDEIWLRDSDIVLVPKSDLLATDDFIQLVFTRGLYGVVPLNVGVSWTNLTNL